MSANTADRLFRKVWSYVTLYWHRRGCEGQCLLRLDSFHFGKDAEGNNYITMSHDELTKKHQGGLSDKQSEERQMQLYSTVLQGDAFSCLKMYISKFNPLSKAKTGDKFQIADSVWYENKPLGKNCLSKTLEKSPCEPTSMNHCVRARAIELWSDLCVPIRHIMNISGHVNERSLASYNRRPSTSQLKNCCDILSSAMQNGQAPVPYAHGGFASRPAALAASPFVATTNTASLMAPNSSLGRIFNSCSIGQAQVFMLPQNGLIFSKP